MFQEVYTALFFDEEMEIIGETPEFESYELAQLVGGIVAKMVPDIAYFSVEKYYKKVEADEVWR